MLEKHIREAFKRVDSVEFELLRSSAGGDSKSLLRIDPERAVPGVSALRSLMGASTIYIRHIAPHSLLEVSSLIFTYQFLYNYKDSVTAFLMLAGVYFRKF